MASASKHTLQSDQAQSAGKPIVPGVARGGSSQNDGVPAIPVSLILLYENCRRGDKQFSHIPERTAQPAYRAVGGNGFHSSESSICCISAAACQSPDAFAFVMPVRNMAAAAATSPESMYDWPSC
jgi:hypothetical protein